MNVLDLSDATLDEAVEMLHSGGTVVYPTETAYALGADPLNPDAVEKIFRIKGRSEGKPLGMIAHSRAQVEALCIIRPQDEPLVSLWPATLSVLLNVRPVVDAIQQRGLSMTIAGGTRASIRVSPYYWATKLTERFGRPLIATSANRSGLPTCYTIRALLEQFASEPAPDVLLDGGDLPLSLLSTVAAVEDGRIVVYRRGAVPIVGSPPPA